jgi:hypothetical protein
MAREANRKTVHCTLGLADDGLDLLERRRGTEFGNSYAIQHLPGARGMTPKPNKKTISHYVDCQIKFPGYNN